jgi:hypothetical protein
VSTLTQIADAVTERLNGGTYAVPVQAVRLHQPAFTLEELASLRVSVVPRVVQIAPASRDSVTLECVVDVGVQQKLPAQQPDGEIDALLDLVESIADRLRFARLDSFPEAVWSGIAHDPVVSAESLEQHRVFTSVLSVTYRVRR